MLKNQWAGCGSLATAGSCFHCRRFLSLADLEESYSPTHQIDQHRLSWESRCQRRGDVKQRPNGVNLPFTNNRQLLRLCGLSTVTAEERRVLPKVSDVRAAQRTPSFLPQRHVLGRAGFKRGIETDTSLAESGLATRSACLPPPNRSPQFPRLRNALHFSPQKQDFTEVAVLLRQTHQSQDLHRQTYKAKAYPETHTNLKANVYPETPTKRRPTPPDLQCKSLLRDSYKVKTYTAKPTKQKPAIRHLQSLDLHRQTYKAKAYHKTPTKRNPTPPNLQIKSLP